MKNVKLVIISSFLAIIICLVGLLVYNQATKSNPLKSGKDSEAGRLVTINNKNPRKDKEKFNKFPGLNMEKTNLKLSYEGEKLNISLPVYVEKNRYFLPLTELMDELDGSIDTKDNICVLKLNNITVEIDTKTNTFKTGSDTFKLKLNIINLDNVTYVSMFDFTRMFNLKPVWNYESSSITFFRNREQLSQSKATQTEKTALLRLEDISSGENERYGTSESLYKLRIVSDYLWSKQIPFHIAWVPRYIDHSKGKNIDDDLTKNTSIHNTDFIYTLDYLESNGGIIGLHGYTHQALNEQSVVGTEFGNRKDKQTFSDEYAVKRITYAKETANYLDIPYAFFEAPHYSAPFNVMRIMENNFDFLYEPYSTDGLSGNSYITTKKLGNRIVKYVPTPLDYLDGKPDLPNMFKRIGNLKPDMMASLFFHPSIEFEDINVAKGADGYPTYTYSDKSALHQIVDTIENKGYSFKKITDLK